MYRGIFDSSESMIYSTYVLENSKERLYIGHTDNLKGRLLRHDGNRVKSTSYRGPWKVIYTKLFSTRSLAVQHEKYLKSLKSSKYIKENLSRL